MKVVSEKDGKGADIEEPFFALRVRAKRWGTTDGAYTLPPSRTVENEFNGVGM